MAGYSLLDGITVIEASQFGPSALGGLLADLGARVIKVEDDQGDPIRAGGEWALGGPDGPGLLHLRWNRGKQSVQLNLKTAEGVEAFRDLAASASVVVEGMRAGTLDRLGLGYEQLSKINPSLVFCSLSGLGSFGPYHTLGSHAPAFDAFAGLTALSAGSRDPVTGSLAVPVAMYAMGLYGALGTVAAVRHAERTGRGCRLEVAAVDCAAGWLPGKIDAELNRDTRVARPGFANADGRMAKWPRLTTYETADGAPIFFQAFKDKFWFRFCAALERSDLAAQYQSGASSETDQLVFDELTKVFRERSTAEWMQLFVEHDIPALPVNDFAHLVGDPHFVARDNIYEVDHPVAGRIRLSGTPIKVDGQAFASTPAPELGADTQRVLRELE
jgi:crotonobetainyl-CoA:carnitine CoA-transferase CaiB-like acyl-CoA transferase